MYIYAHKRPPKHVHRKYGQRLESLYQGAVFAHRPILQELASDELFAKYCNGPRTNPETVKQQITTKISYINIIKHLLYKTEKNNNI